MSDPTHEALRRYGAHESECGVERAGGVRQEADHPYCDCGLRAALSTTPAQTRDDPYGDQAFIEQVGREFDAALEGAPMTSDPTREAWEAIRAAITNEGPEPIVHRAIMARHRQEWPTLWHAIDAALSTTPAPNPTWLTDAIRASLNAKADAIADDIAVEFSHAALATPAPCQRPHVDEPHSRTRTCVDPYHGAPHE